MQTEVEQSGALRNTEAETNVDEVDRSGALKRKPKWIKNGDLSGDKEAYLKGTISLIVRSQNRQMSKVRQSNVKSPFYFLVESHSARLLPQGNISSFCCPS